ncbi:hexokinase [Nematocida sp. LUAm3]|nr:hexokinase [Nematocida sp. LUAm3]KAI5174914.1 hexokinase [Nematocida sp. LUAm2]KAI5177487.1 hexokinase [Nematocida sp. LUAm1]
MKGRGALIIIFAIISMAYCADDKSVDLAKGYFNSLSASLQDKDSSLLKTYILLKKDKASFSEAKAILCVDLGGSSLKLATINEIDGQLVLMKNSTEIHKNPNGKEISASNCTVYQWMGEHIHRYLDEKRTKGIYLNRAVLTFSFPLELKDNEYHVVKYTKELKWRKPSEKDMVKDSNGTYREIPIRLLNIELKRLGENIEFCIILNDSMATLLSGLYSRKSTILGVVLGTGTNGSFYEEASNLPISHRDEANEYICVLNSEWGAYSEKPIQRYTDEYDRELDKARATRGTYIAEKLVGGMYFEEYVNYAFQAEVKKAEEISDISPSISSYTIKNQDIFSSDKSIISSISSHIRENMRSNPNNGLDKNNTNIRTQIEKVQSILITIIANAKQRRLEVLAALMSAMIMRKEEDDLKRYVIQLNGSGCKDKQFHDDLVKEIVKILTEINSPAAKKKIVLVYDETASLTGAVYGLKAF